MGAGASEVVSLCSTMIGLVSLVRIWEPAGAIVWNCADMEADMNKRDKVNGNFISLQR